MNAVIGFAIGLICGLVLGIMVIEEEEWNIERERSNNEEEVSEDDFMDLDDLRRLLPMPGEDDNGKAHDPDGKL